MPDCWCCVSQRLLNVSRGSASLWVREIELTENQRKQLKSRPGGNTRASSRKRTQGRLDREKLAFDEAVLE